MTKENVTLSNGRVIKHRSLPNGAWEAYATPGDEGMTNAEWIEYCAVVRARSHKALKEAHAQRHARSVAAFREKRGPMDAAERLSDLADFRD